MRVVIDTNVFVSSFFGGRPREVIGLWMEGRITLCLCTGIVDEYIAVLSRMGLGPGGGLDELMEWIASGRNIAFIDSPPPVRVVEADPDDDKFLACALALDAKYLVSGARHLLDLGTYRGVRIVNPATFLTLLNAPPAPPSAR